MFHAMHGHLASLYSYKNRVGDDGMPATLQYRPSDLYLTDMKESMAIYPHFSPHMQIRPSLVHPFLPQDLDVPGKAGASGW